MIDPIKPLVAGNWKMNGLKRSAETLIDITKRYDGELRRGVDLMVCPPATCLQILAHAALGSFVRIGAQDCHAMVSGAHTGDISAEMVADSGATAVIVGHSERRTDHGETDSDVHAKALAAHRAGLAAIICIGETEAERKAGDTLDVVKDQLAGSVPDGITSENTVIAYEPVWAIGTGLTPTAADVAEVHAEIRAGLIERFGDPGTSIRILYGGSVKPANAAELMGIDHVNGALVGGASLKADDFLGIAEVYR